MMGLWYKSYPWTLLFSRCLLLHRVSPTLLSGTQAQISLTVLPLYLWADLPTSKGPSFSKAGVGLSDELCLSMIIISTCFVMHCRF